MHTGWDGRDVVSRQINRTEWLIDGTGWLIADQEEES